MSAIFSERLTTVIDELAISAKDNKPLCDALRQASMQLDERKIIERAREILMYQREIAEDEANLMLQSMAIKKKVTLAVLSRQLINATRCLT